MDKSYNKTLYACFIGYIVQEIVNNFVPLLFLTILPNICRSAFIGLLIAVAIYAVGGGLLEVLVSPIVEACPTPNKEKAMSLLHSFYCWGHVAVVLLSTVFFSNFWYPKLEDYVMYMGSCSFHQYDFLYKSTYCFIGE